MSSIQILFSTSAKVKLQRFNFSLNNPTIIDINVPNQQFCTETSNLQIYFHPLLFTPKAGQHLALRFVAFKVNLNRHWIGSPLLPVFRRGRRHHHPAPFPVLRKWFIQMPSNLNISLSKRLFFKKKTFICWGGFPSSANCECKCEINPPNKVLSRRPVIHNGNNPHPEKVSPVSGGILNRVARYFRVE